MAELALKMSLKSFEIFSKVRDKEEIHRRVKVFAVGSFFYFRENVHEKIYIEIFIFQLWYKELGKIKPEQKLPMMYLANDLVQNSRKKYPEVAKEFGTVMKLVFTHLVALNLDAKTQNSINRLVNIWRERQIFDKKIISDMSTVWESRAQKAPLSDEPKRKNHNAPYNIPR